MFAKLKKKIEEESLGDRGKYFATSNLTNKKNVLDHERTEDPEIETESLPFPLRKGCNSTTDLYNCSQQQMMTKTLSQDDLPALQYKQDQMKRLEGKLKECSRVIQDYKKQTEKLEEDLIIHMTASKAELDEVVQEWKKKYESLQLENQTLNEKLHTAEIFNIKITEKQDAFDELEGLQTQEMAKIKHLLLNCQQELQQSNKNFEAISLELRESKDAVEKYVKKIEHLQKQLNSLEDERCSLKEQESSNKETIKELGESRSLLDVEVQQLRKELQQITTKYNQSEQTINNLQDENYALRHTHEIYCKQSITVIEEKESLVSYLSEKVELLEQRLANYSLSEDSQLQSVITERENLEKKLEEARHHVNDIKSTWSEKIMSLEKQISHLNEKMAEDNEEQVKLEKKSKAKEGDLNRQLNVIESQLDAATAQLQEITLDREQKTKHLEEQINSFKKQVSELEKSLLQTKTDMTNKCKKLEHEKDELQQLKQQNEEFLEKNIEELKQKANDYRLKHQTLEEKCRSMKEHEEILQRELIEKDASIKTLTESLNTGKNCVLELEKKVESLSKVNEVQNLTIIMLEKNVAVSKEEQQTLFTDYEECQRKYQDLLENYQQLEQMSLNEKDELNTKITSLETAVTLLEEKISATQQQLQEMDRYKKQNAEISSQHQKTKEWVVKLENEVAEKSKVIRLQQQRINDMKKTLQKELKVLALPFELSNGEATDKENFATLQVDNQTTANFVQRLQSLDSKSFTEDINFRYLKHVILKFMTSREYEAQHLIKAIAVLLQFSPEEEQLVKDTLDWKMSWFGTKPEFGKGQMAKTIPIN